VPDRIGCRRLAGQHERLWPTALAGRDLLHAAARRDGSILVGDRFSTLVLVSVAMLDEEPVITVAAVVLAVVPHPHEHPAPLQLLTGKCELQVSVAKRTFRIGTIIGRPEAAVP
jgi:hypothetical protein